ncbi:alpha/beta hydrolase, partial [Mycobacteroides abscessus subsp. massiliense]|uniref:alpha/beta hydrolase family protein n=1 Tax=Mycobacteroides abscessus TaxID=36809 RepID=UPI003CEF250C
SSLRLRVESTSSYLADVTGMLPQVKVPVLLALGDEDLNVDVNETERIYRQLLPPQQLTVQRYPHASHNIVKAALDNDQNWRSTLVALFAPRSLYAPGYLENMRNYVAGQPVH